MRPVYIFTLCLPVAALLTACASAPTDPREGGLIGGISGLQTGAYEARVREREQRLERLREIQEGLETEQVELEREREEHERALAAERSRLDALTREVVVLSDTVDGLEAQTEVDARRLEELQERIAILKQAVGEQQSGIDALEGVGRGGGADPALELRRRQLEEQREMLRKEYELLLDLSLQLAR